MTSERRFIERGTSRLKLEQRDDGTRVLVGYAAVFYRADDPGTEYELWGEAVERIMPGAFDAALAEGDDVRALFNHDSNHLLGRRSSGTLRLTVDAVGLRFEIDLPNTQSGRDTAVSAERGDLTGCSFAFTLREGGSEWRKEGDREVREIRATRLYDVGPVTYPAYKATSVSVRSEDVDGIRREWEQERQGELRASAEKAEGIGLDLDLAEKSLLLNCEP